MNKSLKLSLMAAVVTLTAGCTSAGFYPIGGIYDGKTIPHPMSKNENSGGGKTGDKVGESCAMGILGLAAFGDASVDAAKKQGGISDVHSVEFKNFSILGFVYTNACTEVHGK
jgi:hypothetical protein